MHLNLSSLQDKLRIAAPDLIVGVMGLPIVFAFQHIADNAKQGDLYLPETRLYLLLAILILYYLVFALTVLDLIHAFDELSLHFRAAQAVLALIAVGLVFLVGYKGRSERELISWLNLSVWVLWLIPCPKMLKRELVTKDDSIPLFMTLLIICSTFLGMAA
jgi:hypothetical protein